MRRPCSGPGETKGCGVGRGQGRHARGRGPILMLRRSKDWTQRRWLGRPRTAPAHRGWKSILIHIHAEPHGGSLLGSRVLAEVTTVRVRSHWFGGQYGTWCLHKKRSRDRRTEKPREDGAELERGVYSPRNRVACLWPPEPGEGLGQCSWAAAEGADPADAGSQTAASERERVNSVSPPNCGSLLWPLSETVTAPTDPHCPVCIWKRVRTVCRSPELLTSARGAWTWTPRGSGRAECREVERPRGNAWPLCGEGRPGLTTCWMAGLQVRAPPSSGDVLDEVSLVGSGDKGTLL